MRRPSASTTYALFALIVALGGSAAADPLGHAARRLVRGDFATGAVGTRQVRDRSLRASDFSRRTRGPSGVPGEPGSLVGAAGGDLTGGYPDPALRVGAVTEGSLAPGAVTAEKVAPGSVDGARLTDAAVAGPDLADGAVGAAKIVDGIVSTAKLADGAVTSAAIADGAVQNADLADNSVGSAELADNSVAASDLANDSAGSSELATDSVTSAKVNDGALSLDEIAVANARSNTWTSPSVAAGTCADVQLTNSPFDSVTTGDRGLPVEFANIDTGLMLQPLDEPFALALRFRVCNYGTSTASVSFPDGNFVALR